MSTEAHIRLMHAVIDGDASPAEREELTGLMAGDAALRTDYEKLQNLAVALRLVPAVEPPASLLQSVIDKVKTESPKKNVGADQLFQQRSVIDIPAANNGTTAMQQRNASLVTNFLNSIWETVMGQKKEGLFSGSKNKVLIGGGIAAAAVFALSTQLNFPSDSSDTSGTISPAVRFRADQPTGNQIQVGGSAATLGSASAPGGNAVAADAKGGVSDAKGGVSDAKGGVVDAKSINDRKGGVSDAKGGVADAKGGVVDAKSINDRKGGVSDAKGGVADAKGGVVDAKSINDRKGDVADAKTGAQADSKTRY